MGNVLGGRWNEWRFKCDSGSVFELNKVKYYCTGDATQQIYISGPLALILTLEIDNANIEVTDFGHLICLIGKGNSINIRGSQIKLRIEGEDNKLIGDGAAAAAMEIQLYTDNQVAVEGLQLASLKKLTDGDNNVVTDAPKKLELLEDSSQRKKQIRLGENAIFIRCTYGIAPSQDGGKGDAA